MNAIVSATNSSAAVDSPATDPAQWVEEHGNYLYNFAYGQLRDPHAAEDAVQETLLAALRSRERFGQRCSERTWLVSILRHKIYDQLRRRCQWREVPFERTRSDDGSFAEESLLRVHEVAADCVAPSRRIELGEFRRAVEQALGTLPSRLAQAFQLYEMDELPGREVCKSLNVSEQNLWVMLHRARKHLRTELADWWIPAPAAASSSPCA